MLVRHGEQHSVRTGGPSGAPRARVINTVEQKEPGMRAAGDASGHLWPRAAGTGCRAGETRICPWPLDRARRWAAEALPRPAGLRTADIIPRSALRSEELLRVGAVTRLTAGPCPGGRIASGNEPRPWCRTRIALVSRWTPARGRRRRLDDGLGAPPPRFAFSDRREAAAGARTLDRLTGEGGARHGGQEGRPECASTRARVCSGHVLGCEGRPVSHLSSVQRPTPVLKGAKRKKEPCGREAEPSSAASPTPAVTNPGGSPGAPSGASPGGQQQQTPSNRARLTESPVNGGESGDKAARKKKARTTFTGQQIFELERQFENKKYLSSSERAEMAKLLNVTETQRGAALGHLLSVAHVPAAEGCAGNGPPAGLDLRRPPWQRRRQISAVSRAASVGNDPRRPK
ncbi:hypothetical protein HPB48_002097 [Haemaphysalis longicornis]|uniref:Homeobox domain-containing protein n=1 Tax=Haemaphysalis longicornis TaxID=44386 RepID=A0A9J6FH39_HAELO|nr:hypothetical protein HPB48_002097 [Haemaphysalis longicornis]